MPSTGKDVNSNAKEEDFEDGSEADAAFFPSENLTCGFFDVDGRLFWLIGGVRFDDEAGNQYELVSAGGQEYVVLDSKEGSSAETAGVARFRFDDARLTDCPSTKKRLIDEFFGVKSSGQPKEPPLTIHPIRRLCFFKFDDIPEIFSNGENDADSPNSYELEKSSDDQSSAAVDKNSVAAVTRRMLALGKRKTRLLVESIEKLDGRVMRQFCQLLETAEQSEVDGGICSGYMDSPSSGNPWLVRKNPSIGGEKAGTTGLTRGGCGSTRGRGRGRRRGRGARSYGNPSMPNEKFDSYGASNSNSASNMSDSPDSKHPSSSTGKSRKKSATRGRGRGRGASMFNVKTGGGDGFGCRGRSARGRGRGRPSSD